jgi:hypothetical protein
MSFTLLLILFNSFISALYGDLNSKSLSAIHEMTDSKIFTINITKNENEILKLYNGNEYKNVFISIIPLNEKNINVSSTETKILNDTSLNNNCILINYIPSEYSGKEINIYISSTSEEVAQVEVTNNLLKDLPIYQTIFVNENTVNKNNFVFFLNETKNEYELKINFNGTTPKSCFYQIVRLADKNPNYILPASNYKDAKNNCDFEKLTFNYKGVSDTNSNKKEIAFIFSIKDEKNFSYIVTITKIDEAMNIFLFVSIGLAGVFAVITFFLIRRKQSIDTKNEDNQEDLYNNEENKDE